MLSAILKISSAIFKLRPCKVVSDKLMADILQIETKILLNKNGPVSCFKKLSV